MSVNRILAIIALLFVVLSFVISGYPLVQVAVMLLAIIELIRG